MIDGKFINGVVVCVNYDDFLSITLPKNMKYVDRMLVITHPSDHKTIEAVTKTPGVEVLKTDSFYAEGASFNKGAAMEEGFDLLGRSDWFLIWDADTLFPDNMEIGKLDSGFLYTPWRRILNDPKIYEFDQDVAWKISSRRRDREFCGYFQLFDAKDKNCQQLPWYDTNFVHAGGADGLFQARWPTHAKRRLPFDVLHLGPADTNWFGRQSNRMDGEDIANAIDCSKKMELFLHFKGWGRPKKQIHFKEKLNDK